MIHTCPPALANMMTPAKGGTSWGFLPSALRIFLPPQQHLTILDPPLSVVNNFQATRDNKTQTLRVWSCLSPGSGRNGGRGRPGRTPTPALAPSGRCCCSARSRWSRSTRRSARTRGPNTASDRPGRRGPLQYRPGLLRKPFFPPTAICGSVDCLRARTPTTHSGCGSRTQKLRWVVQNFDFGTGVAGTLSEWECDGDGSE